MTKTEFLDNLQGRLSVLKFDERQKTLQYYSEMIEDRIEDGVSEEEAVNSLGNVDSIVAEILKDVPTNHINPEKQRPSGVTITLFICSLPILLIVFSVALAAVACLIAAVVCLGVIPVTFAACTLGLLAGGVLQFILGKIIIGLAAIGVCFICAGLFILTTKPIFLLCRETVLLVPKLIKFLMGKCKKDGAAI